MDNLMAFFISFLFNLSVVLVVVRLIYYPKTQNKRYVFTFLAFNTIIYFVLSFLTSIEISVGVGFGMFAIFSILRYRTDPIPIREMTYLFVITALPVMNSAGLRSEIWLELVIANLSILIILFILEREWGFHYEASKKILYEKIELIKPQNRHELISDLEERTGLIIKRVVVGKVNFLRDTAEIKIYYDDPEHEEWLQMADILSAYIQDEDT
jgi:uncharacterized membrane protein